jgi:hypothetical protein
MWRPRLGRRSRGHLIVTSAFVLVTATLTWAPGAWAHGGETTAMASDAVRQAIAHLVHDPPNMAAVEDKVGDALEAEDTSGVDLALVEEAQAAVEANHMMRARILLERAIGARSDLAGTDMQPILQVPPGSSTVSLAVGSATGTNVVTDEMPGRGALTGTDLVLLLLAGLMAVCGVLLSFRVRPPDSIRALRRLARRAGRA